MRRLCPVPVPRTVNGKEEREKAIDRALDAIARALIAEEMGWYGLDRRVLVRVLGKLGVDPESTLAAARSRKYRILREIREWSGGVRS